MSWRSQTLSSRNAYLLIAILAGVLIYLLYCLYVDYSLGGNSWKQGDWLINELAGPVRRGLFGTALLRLSDVLWLSPLLLLILLQGIIITLIFAIVGAAVLDLGAPDRLVLILLSPAFVVLFWFNDPYGSVRKEILTYLAFLPLVAAALKGRAGYIACAVSGFLYSIAVFAHEGNVFFLPFLCAAMWIVLPPNAPSLARVAVIALPTLAAIGGGIYASLHSNLPDSGLMCQQLVQRGLNSAVCDGAIAYVERATKDAHMHPGRLLARYFRNFLLLYAVCIVSFRILVHGSARVQLWCFGAIASGLVFLPIYFFAIDYGRWLNFHITSLVFLSLILLLKSRPAWLYEAPSRIDYLCVLSLSLIVGVSHLGVLIDGFVVKVARALYSLAT